MPNHIRHSKMNRQTQLTPSSSKLSALLKSKMNQFKKVKWRFNLIWWLRLKKFKISCSRCLLMKLRRPMFRPKVTRFMKIKRSKSVKLRKLRFRSKMLTLSKTKGKVPFFLIWRLKNQVKITPIAMIIPSQALVVSWPTSLRMWTTCMNIELCPSRSALLKLRLPTTMGSVVPRPSS